MYGNQQCAPWCKTVAARTVTVLCCVRRLVTGACQSSKCMKIAPDILQAHLIIQRLMVMPDLCSARFMLHCEPEVSWVSWRSIWSVVSPAIAVFQQCLINYVLNIMILSNHSGGTWQDTIPHTMCGLLDKLKRSDNACLLTNVCLLRNWAGPCICQDYKTAIYSYVTATFHPFTAFVGD